MGCTICTSGTRYRVSIAALDAHQVGTPYADLARQVKRVLDRQYRAYRMVSPLRTRSGPFSFSNPAYNVQGQNVPAGLVKAGHFLIYHDWEIGEDRGGCHIRVTETLTIEQDGRPKRTVRVPPITPPLGDKWLKAKRVNPLGDCDTTLIVVDAPGSAAITQAFAGQQPAGFKLHVDQTIEILDQNNKVIDTKNWTIDIAVSAAGVMTPAR